MNTLLDRHDLVLADLDGTLYQGRAAIPGAVDAIRAAADRGVRTLYITNNAARSPGDVAAHLAELGYPAGADDVATSSQAAAALLAEQLSDGSKVLVVGTAALGAEITAVGLTPVDSADGATAVVQGLDPQLRYATLAESTGVRPTAVISAPSAAVPTTSTLAPSGICSASSAAAACELVATSSAPAG